MSCASNQFLARLRRLSCAQQIGLLQALPEKTLRMVLRKCSPPDCDCDILAPCPEHGKDGCDCPREFVDCPHTPAEIILAEDAMAWLQRTLYPAIYGEPRMPPERSRALLREARAVVLAERAANGYGLYHVRDYVPPRWARKRSWEPENVLGIERTVSTRETNPLAPANGAPLAGVVKRRGS